MFIELAVSDGEKNDESYHSELFNTDHIVRVFKRDAQTTWMQVVSCPNYFRVIGVYETIFNLIKNAVQSPAPTYGGPR